MQTSYAAKPDPAFLGMLADNGPNDIRSKVAQAAIPFGRLVALAAVAGLVRLPATNDADVVFSADLVTSNSTVGVVKVTDKAGTVTTTTLTATVFATDHATTMAAIATKIDAVTGIASATVGGASNRTITVKADGDYEIELSGFVVTLGGSQATASYVHRTTDAAAGVAMHEHKAPTSAGVAEYATQDSVDVLRKGRIWVWTEETVVEGDQVYWRHKDGGTGKAKGQTRKSTDSGTATALTGWTFAGGRTGAGLVQVECNLP